MIRPAGDGGFATAETAMALPALVLVLAASLWAIVVVGAQLECVDAARAGARAAARGESLNAVRAAALRGAPPAAEVSVVRDEELTKVVVSAVARPDWGTTLPPIPVTATAWSATEPGRIDPAGPAEPPGATGPAVSRVR